MTTVARLVRAGVVLIALVSAALIAGGCGGTASGATGGVPELGYMTERDTSGVTTKRVKQCEKESKGRYTIKMVPIGPNTDQARDQLTRRLAAKDTSMDLLKLDTIWTAEFSDAGWLLDLTSRMKPIADRYVPASIASTYYKGRYWAVSAGTDAPLLYYRTDIIDTPPTTWEEMAEMAKAAQQEHPDMLGYVYQGKQYEGGTVNAIEFMTGAGAQVLSEDGRKSAIGDGDGAEHALTFLHQLFEDGVSPKVATTFQEEEGRLAFQNGTAIFMRNWPYAYALMGTLPESKVKGRFDVVPLPKWEGRDSANVLGGQNIGISAYTDEPELAYEAIMCLTDPVAQKAKAIAVGQLPTMEEVYLDPDVIKALPFIPRSRAALDTGVNRPVSPYYGDITIAIYKAWNDVAAGRITPKDAVKRMDRSIQLAVEGEAEI